MQPRKLQESLTRAINMLSKEDRQYLLGQIEESRWKSGPNYSEGTHILMNVMQKLIEKGENNE